MSGFLKNLQTSKNKIGLDHAKVLPSERGPRTSEAAALSPIEFVCRFAYPEEIERFKKEIEARRADEPKWRYLKCDKCNFKTAVQWRRRSPVGDACISCNWNGRADLGHFVEMIPAEVKKWEQEKAAKAKRETEQHERAQKNAESDRRRAAGLE